MQRFSSCCIARRSRLARALVFALGMAGFASAGTASAQDVSSGLEGRAPRFLLAREPGGGGPIPLDVSRTPVLLRRIAVDLDGVSLAEALADISARSGLALVYGGGVLPAGKRVNLRADGITVAAALTDVLADVRVDVLFNAQGGATIVRRQPGTHGVLAGAIVGRVTNAKTGEGLVGAEISLEGTRWRTGAGEDGRYRLVDVAAGSYTLVVRRIGYARQTRAVTVTDGQELTVDVALEPQPTQLDEVVTTVTGEQRIRELGHVVGRINADSLVKEAPVSSLSELLNGRVPGLQVFQSQGSVGGQVKLQIRGANSTLLNTEPIVIIDGVRHTTRSAATTAAFSGPEPTSPLNDLNPNDIESIEVVKGPSAATLYGTDAANGVLVITTKRGRPGPARWNVYAKGTTTAIPTDHFPDMYWGWGTVNGVPNDSTRNCNLNRIGGGFCTQQDSISLLPNPLNDPELTVISSKPRWAYGMNVGGGRQDVQYYFAGDYEDATGPIQMPPALAEQLMAERGLTELPEEWRNPNTLTKLNLRANVAAVLGATADLRVNTGYVHSATRSLGTFTSSPYAGAFSRTPANRYAAGANPAERYLQTSTERADRFVGSASGQWRPVIWLATRATVGLDLGTRNRYSLSRRGDAPNDFDASEGAVGDDRVRQIATTAELGATATLRRGRLTARTAVGAQYVRTLNDALGAAGTNLPPGGTSVGEAANVQSRQIYLETVTLGSYIEETLGLNDRLFLTGALRVDGASTFGQNYDATVYPKVSASWLVSEEPFLPRLPGLDELRLRYAFGASGQQPRPEWTRPSFFVNQSVENGALTTIVGLVGLGNPALRPERVREHEFGFDIAALANRLRLGLTWYQRRAVDQIAFVPLAVGLGGRYTNLGLTTQHGFEAELTAQVLNTRLVSWDVTWQYGLHRTKLEELGGGSEWRAPEGGYVEGYPLGARFQRPVLGYADANGDGIIRFNEVQVGDTEVYMGESTPPRSQTLTTVVGLFERRLRLSALLERRTGFTQGNPYACRSCLASVDPATPLAEQARVSAPVGVALEPGDFTRLREVTAALDLPVSLTRALRIRSATLAISARNVALWTDFSGPDPESAAVGGVVPVDGGVANGIPQGRSWTLRLDLGL